ncbi:hypothetical protein Trydic_g17699 [Trypoxylus dichotomus]
MEQSKTYKIWKNYLIIVNILFEIFGAAAIFLGFYAILRSSNTSGILAATLFISGATVVLISILGYLGAYKENPKLLKLYGVIVIILLLLKVCGFVYFILNPVHHPTDADFKKIYENYDENPSIAASVDTLQREFYCCGYDGPHSMLKLDGTYPSSCCRKGQTTSCFLPYPDGCAAKILGTLNPILIMSRVMGYAGFVLQLFCVFGAFYMADSIENKRPAGSKSPYSNF